MIIKTKLDKNDWKVFNHYVKAKVQEDARSWMDSPIFNVFIWLLIAVVILGVTRPDMGLHWQSAAFAAVVCSILFFSIYSKEVKVLKKLIPRVDDSIYEEKTIEVSESGIRSKNSKHDIFLNWENFSSVEFEGGLIMLFLDRANAIVIPSAQVSEPAALVEKVRALIKM
ncbi:hypothetical protein [Microbulbifer rhizosphaerae]|uniref:Putative membrane protein n=1 Tax=Microbulbifer rhizosphaerae TaxID=1562603 RepID=A0A7W4ZB81_9GAMM|nr:hypothetical protein [Microbulbifer rhizosphaerae]MBB3063642.1 putative membrane protein [Microbulbifer rhizosphaerae]